MKQLEIGYYKAIKKILNLSSHESNHYACQESNLLTFEHLINKIKILAAFRFFCSPCDFIKKAINFLYISSMFLKQIFIISKNKYDIDMLFENDIDAVMSRILFVQQRESQMRTAIELF